MTSSDWLTELAAQQERASKRKAKLCKAKAGASTAWDRLVKAVGEPEAKEIMRRLMGEKIPGRPSTDEDCALNDFIYDYVRHFGLQQKDGKIAKRIFESRPLYYTYASGTIMVANHEVEMDLPDELPVEINPLGMRLAAIKKRVERIRREAIKSGSLPKEYAPKTYHRYQ